MGFSTGEGAKREHPLGDKEVPWNIHEEIFFGYPLSFAP
jgi:hypothetical protein